jgi:hypothetical protein
MVITKSHVYKVNVELIEGTSAVIEIEECTKRRRMRGRRMAVVDMEEWKCSSPSSPLQFV